MNQTQAGPALTQLHELGSVSSKKCSRTFALAARA
eukprot:CAMPEP_0119084292 /NCGR_PEP_ID=MMETSP1178-20130426/129069_1 /TAXON_ID=33656 /ORGANISM="unid sp, Strain CCMP2000" /LENGTH=34 /DNA_ID= /DNA_START= /DNA_END= /DNA_ORIENTATION=